MSQSDPTDNALAAIASILEEPPVIPPRERERPAAEDVPAATPPPLEEFAAPPPLEVAPPLETASPVEAYGYSKMGPGPIAAIRFKWAVREHNGDYYVDESVGADSAPMVTGPMTRDAAIQLVDDREAAAHRRFEQLKTEMAGRSAAAKLARKDSGEA